MQGILVINTIKLYAAIGLTYEYILQNQKCNEEDCEKTAGYVAPFCPLLNAIIQTLQIQNRNKDIKGNTADRMVGLREQRQQTCG